MVGLDSDRGGKKTQAFVASNKWLHGDYSRKKGGEKNGVVLCVIIHTVAAIGSRFEV